MSVDCVGLTPESTLDDALLLFDRDRMGALPVLDDGRVVGIFSSRDLLAAYKELFGVGEKGSVLLAIEDDGHGRPNAAGAMDGGSGDGYGRPNAAGAMDGGSGDGRKGLMTRIVTLLEQHDIPFTRLLRIYDEENGNRIYLRLNTFKIAQVVNLLREAGIHPAV
jgi:acetoin utilization protein AcuB